MAESFSRATAACVQCASRPGTSRLTSSQDGAVAGACCSERARASRSRRQEPSPKLTAGQGASTRDPVEPSGPQRGGGGRLGLRCGGPPLRGPWPWRGPLPLELAVGPVAPAGQDPEQKEGRVVNIVAPFFFSQPGHLSVAWGRGVRGRTAQELAIQREASLALHVSERFRGPSPPWQGSPRWGRESSPSHPWLGLRQRRARGEVGWFPVRLPPSHGALLP